MRNSDGNMLDQVHRVREDMEHGLRFESKDQKRVRNVTAEILKSRGHKHIKIYDVKQGLGKWELCYEGSLKYSERAILEKLIAEALGTEMGVMLVGTGYN